MIENKNADEIRAYDASLIRDATPTRSPVAAATQSVGTDSLMAAFGMRH